MDWLQILFGTLTLIRFTKPLSVNIARGKPTFQSTTQNGDGPWRAVDGNKDTAYGEGSCTHTIMTSGSGTTNPWWAVDLQWSRLVERVDLTNRVDVAGRLSNIRIGTTDVSPTTTAPTPTNFDICASQDPAVGAGVTQQFTCGGQGRYLVVLLKGTNKILTLCEVEVYASRKELNFESTLTSRLVGHIMETLAVRTERLCAMRCLKNPQCSSFNLGSDSSEAITCELNEDISDEEITNGLTTDPQYAFYQISYQG